jgi:hypothetical protein
MRAKAKRKHGLSRLEKLLQASIRQELQIKALRRDLCALSARIGQIEHCPAIESDIPGPWRRIVVSDSSEVWPWKPSGVYGGGSGLDRSKP